jgi:prolipoprotein diacylglyceryltransferase
MGNVQDHASEVRLTQFCLPTTRPPARTEVPLRDRLDLSLAAFLIVPGEKRRIRPPGLFALYVAGYSAFRVVEESVRIDYSVYIVGMRLNFWIAVAGTLGGLIWFTAIQRQARLSLQRV